MEARLSEIRFPVAKAPSHRSLRAQDGLLLARNKARQAKAQLGKGPVRLMNR
jgi:hypothetical protein